MKISLGSWAFAFGPYQDAPVSFEETVKKLASAGYDGIEICGFPPHVTVEKYPNAAARFALRTFIAEQGLGISGYAADFSSCAPVARENRPRYLDLFRRNLELCHDLRIPAMRVDTVAGPFAVPDEEYAVAQACLAETWRECAEMAAQAQVRLVWEFEPGFAFNKPSEVVAAVERVAHPNFSVLFDTSHAFMCAVIGARQRGVAETLAGGVGEFLAMLRGHIGHIHLIDSDGTLHHDETSTHAPFGAGHVRFAELAPKLLAVPGISWWCIDLCFWPNAWDLVESSREFVARLLGAAASA